MLDATSRRSFLMQSLSALAVLLGRLCGGAIAGASVPWAAGRSAPARLRGARHLYAGIPVPRYAQYVYDGENRLRMSTSGDPQSEIIPTTNVTETITGIGDPHVNDRAADPGAVVVEIRAPW